MALQAYSTDTVAALLSDLSREAPLMLLFLKSVQSLQVGRACALAA